MNQLIDQYLLYRIRSARDPESFGRLYDRYVSALYRFVFLKVSSREQAEDIVSDTFLRFWEQVQKEGEIRHVRGLLYQIARNLVIDLYRKREGTPLSYEGLVTFPEAEPSTESEALQSDQFRQRRVIEAQADLAIIRQKMAQLKEDFQDVLMLRWFDDLSFADIGEVLGKETGAVRVMYHRAKKAFDRLPS
jgi:RNA polymerase sigma-70 factor (ECF subfamily)